MAEHINGPLYWERLGKSGLPMIFVHPNPMDHGCWIYQMSRFSTWYRTIGIDIPGYGKSPTAEPGLTVEDIAQACWEAVDEVMPGEPAILIGLSVGSAVVPRMYHLRPENTLALVLSGTGYSPEKEFAARRIEAYTRFGIDFRWRYVFEDLSPAFRANPLATYFADMFAERNPTCDVETIVRQFEALAKPDPPYLHAEIKAPTLIISGSEDSAHPRVFDLQARIPDSELKIIPGAGHACNMEQPWLYDRHMIEFLTKHGLFEGATQKVAVAV